MTAVARGNYVAPPTLMSRSLDSSVGCPSLPQGARALSDGMYSE